MTEATIAGWCAPRFDALRQEFGANFRERAELGAAVSVYVRGVLVADLWGGWSDQGRERLWGRNTLVNVFSVGKGLLAACAAWLTGQGLLDPDAQVARYWPQFAAAGKGAVTIRQLLSHQAGLPAIRQPLPMGSMLDWDFITGVLAAEAPWWTPGEGHGYHVNTFGFAAGEVIRRITGMSPGQLLRRELAGPLQADVHIGLPATEHGRVAEFVWGDRPTGNEATSGPAEVPGSLRLPGSGQAAQPADGQMAAHAYFNPPDFSGFGVVNTPAWRSAEIPSANAHATAAGVARIYAALAAGGELDGARVIDAAALAAAAEEQVYGPDLVLGRPSRFGLGFQLTHSERELGHGPRCFGHFGAGGSVGFADPDSGLAFGYVTNQMGPRWRNPRNRALIDASYACL